jgi:ABC-type proline/glycine betaine transport system permease subunit
MPAALSSLALLALAAWPFLDRFPSGTPTRETLAFVLALGTCSMLLGLGLGIWIAARAPSASTIAAGGFSVLVALAWWWTVFGPLLRPSTGGWPGG